MLAAEANFAGLNEQNWTTNVLWEQNSSVCRELPCIDQIRSHPCFESFSGFSIFSGRETRVLIVALWCDTCFLTMFVSHPHEATLSSLPSMAGPGPAKGLAGPNIFPYTTLAQPLTCKVLKSASTWKHSLVFANWCLKSAAHFERKPLFLERTEQERAPELIRFGLSPSSVTWWSWAMCALPAGAC